MKYNKSEIMRNAWNIRRTAHVDMGTALRASWALAKAVNEAEVIGEDSGWNYRVTANNWAKGGKNRTYVATRIYTNKWSLKREIKLGFVDNLSGEFVAA